MNGWEDLLAGDTAMENQPAPFPKRTRIPRACTTCQKKKIKCDGRTPCSSCITFNSQCHFLPIERKPSQRKGTKYIQALEERLVRMEALLKRSRIFTAEGNANLQLPEPISQPENECQDQSSGQTHASPRNQPYGYPDVEPRAPLHTQQENFQQTQPPDQPAQHQHSPQPQFQFLPQQDTQYPPQFQHQNVDEPPRNEAPSINASTPPATVSDTPHSTSNSHPTQTLEGSNQGTFDYSNREHESQQIACLGRKSSIRDLSDIMCSLATSSTRGSPPSSMPSNGFSIFSPEGIKWINEKSGGSSFEDTIESCFRDDNKLDFWAPDVFDKIFKKPILRQIPPKAEALVVLKDFFQHFNSIFPLYHEPTFMHLVERHYAGNAYSDIGWWASFNGVLAIAHKLRDRLHVQRNTPPEDDDNLKAWDYFRNAAGVITELTWRSKDLLGVQALLGMALFMQGTPSPEPSAALLAAAIRLSHSIGLHDLNSTIDLDPVEMEQRRRVFWIAYRLDKDICLRLGRPLLQEDNDMDVDLPSEDPKDENGNISLSTGGKLNLFRLTSEFATIESRVYKELYSRKAAKQSEKELLYTISELDYLLEEWKESIPIEFQPENDIETTDAGLILHVLVLHFSYYNTLIAIHRTSVHHGYWTSKSSKDTLEAMHERPLNPRVFSSASICVTAARASIKLIKYCALGEYSYIWVILYYPVSALVTLFANILQNPTEPRAKSDIRLMNTLIDFLSKLRQEGHSVVKRMLRVCTELERIARVVTEDARAEANSQRSTKRKAPTDLEAPKQKTLPFQAPLSSAGFNQSVGRGRLRGPTFMQQQDMPSVMEDTRDMFPTNFALALNTFPPPPNHFVQDYSAFEDLLRADMNSRTGGMFDINFAGDEDSSMPMPGFMNVS